MSEKTSNRNPRSCGSSAANSRKALHLLVRREPVLRADRGTFNLEIVKPHARDAERIEVAEPVAHSGQLVGRGVVAVKGDNQAWREALSHQPFDRGMCFRRGLPRAA